MQILLETLKCNGLREGRDEEEQGREVYTLGYGEQSSSALSGPSMAERSEVDDTDSAGMLRVWWRSGEGR